MLDGIDYSQLYFCFAGPVACGKSTICRKLAAQDPDTDLSISTTTRAPRAGEQDGVHYNFVDQAEFEKRVSAGLFLEHARIGDKLYGTEISNLERSKQTKKDLLLDIDVQGVEFLKQKYPLQTIVICVFPPSKDVLLSRLSSRGADSPERVSARLEIAERELSILKSTGFSDYLLINDSLELVVSQAQSILTSERIRFTRYSKTYLNNLLRVR